MISISKPNSGTKVLKLVSHSYASLVNSPRKTPKNGPTDRHSLPILLKSKSSYKAQLTLNHIEVTIYAEFKSDNVTFSEDMNRCMDG